MNVEWEWKKQISLSPSPSLHKWLPPFSSPPVRKPTVPRCNRKEEAASLLSLLLLLICYPLLLLLTHTQTVKTDALTYLAAQCEGQEETVWVATSEAKGTINNTNNTGAPKSFQLQETLLQITHSYLCSHFYVWASNYNRKMYILSVISPIKDALSSHASKPFRICHVHRGLIY